jgi:hypothetical protein
MLAGFGPVVNDGEDNIILWSWLWFGESSEVWRHENPAETYSFATIPDPSLDRGSDESRKSIDGVA